MKIDLTEYHAKVAADKERVAYLIAEEEMLDDDGYPTEAALEVIKLWHWDDIKGWFDFIENLWWCRSWGWNTTEEVDFDKTVTAYHLSTAGWSGNESLIYAMQENMIWSIVWVSSHRGGHYVFHGKEVFCEE